MVRNLIRLCAKITLYQTADHIAMEMRGLIELRELVVNKSMDLVLSIDEQLASMESQLLEIDKDDIRTLGYQFPEDLDNVPEMNLGGLNDPETD